MHACVHNVVADSTRLDTWFESLVEPAAAMAPKLRLQFTVENVETPLALRRVSARFYTTNVR